MITLQLQFHHSDYPDAKINNSISEILNANVLLSMASIKTGPNGPESWINTAYYGFSKSFDLFILTPPSTQHSQNVEQNKSVAVAIFDSHQTSGGKRGLQIFSSCERATGLKLIEGYERYCERYPGLKEVIKSPEDFVKGIIESKLYIIKPRQVKIFDEPTFGEEKWVTVDIR